MKLSLSSIEIKLKCFAKGVNVSATFAGGAFSDGLNKMRNLAGNIDGLSGVEAILSLKRIISGT